MIVLGYALPGAGVDWTPGRVLVFATMVPAGVVLFAAMWVGGLCVLFWTIEGTEFSNAFTYGGQYLTQYPIDIYSDWLRRFLAYLVPTAFVAYFPALYVLGKEDPLGLPSALQFCAPLIAVAAACLAGLTWRLAVRHYRSAGG